MRRMLGVLIGVLVAVALVIVATAAWGMIATQSTTVDQEVRSSASLS
ncbi:hypothetical protein [Bifidobacterium samirii]|uniref:Uncharacterized protein n=1 Tax=Bifidobacterium samirii TaxID=2306974 RepID=A0A430FWK1_9BIFI|nr:hypothetical protein [Bifidobacterium samirii]RSX58750.1 hypothetical protein D2E24_0046 [Bifidobacterium samirii]